MARGLWSKQLCFFVEECVCTCKGSSRPGCVRSKIIKLLWRKETNSFVCGGMGGGRSLTVFSPPSSQPATALPLEAQCGVSGQRAEVCSLQEPQGSIGEEERYSGDQSVLLKTYRDRENGCFRQELS